MLNENYHGEIYHFTSLIQASWIVDDDRISAHLAMSDECGRGYREDSRKNVGPNTPFISFTRDKNYHIQGNDSTIVCFVFDGDSIQNIRKARLYPYAYNTNDRNESEERVFGVDIYPLHKYLKRIEITVSNKEYSWASDRYFDEEGELYDEFSERFPNLSDLEISRKISDFLISKITDNKLFGNKVIIRESRNCNIDMNKNTIRLTESELHKIVKESVRRVLKESNRFMQEDDVLLQDKAIFGDNNEHSYNWRGYDGWAIGVLSDVEDKNAPKQVRLKYPTIQEVLNNEELANRVMTYRGLNDTDSAYKGGFEPSDINYGDATMALGKLEGVVSNNTGKTAKQLDKALQPPHGYGMNN